MMRKFVIGFLCWFGFTGSAFAQCTVPNNLTNGTNADATQVMANFNALLTCVNTVATPRGYVSGLALSTAGSSASYGIAVGAAASDDATTPMKLSSAYTKTTSAWALGSGNGSLDVGSIAANTWYHVFLIERTDTFVVDVLISTNATIPTLPASYSKQRRIGSMKTDGSSNWTRFIQDGDRFRWATVVTDVNVTNPGTAAVVRTLSVPLGVRVAADVSATFLAASGDPGPGAIYLSDLLQDDQQANAFVATVGGYNESNTAGHTFAAGAGGSIMTNLTQQIRSRVGVSTSANLQFIITTHGWTDTRGK